MFEEIAKHYHIRKPTADNLSELVATIDNYEFTAYCLSTSNKDAYAIIEDADSKRVEEIANIIRQETGFVVTNWLVLRDQKQQAMERFGTMTPKEVGVEDLDIVTYRLNHMPVWMLQLRRA